MYHVHETLSKLVCVHEHNPRISGCFDGFPTRQRRGLSLGKLLEILVVVENLAASLNAAEPQRFTGGGHLLEFKGGSVGNLSDAGLLEGKDARVEIERAETVVLIVGAGGLQGIRCPPESRAELIELGFQFGVFEVEIIGASSAVRAGGIGLRKRLSHGFVFLSQLL